MSKRMLILGLLIAVALIITACGGSSAEEPSQVQAGFTLTGMEVEVPDCAIDLSDWASHGESVALTFKDGEVINLTADLEEKVTFFHVKEGDGDWNEKLDVMSCNEELVSKHENRVQIVPVLDCKTWWFQFHRLGSRDTADVKFFPAQDGFWNEHFDIITLNISWSDSDQTFQEQWDPNEMYEELVAQHCGPP